MVILQCGFLLLVVKLILKALALEINHNLRSIVAV